MKCKSYVISYQLSPPFLELLLALKVVSRPPPLKSPFHSRVRSHITFTLMPPVRWGGGHQAQQHQRHCLLTRIPPVRSHLSYSSRLESHPTPTPPPLDKKTSVPQFGELKRANALDPKRYGSGDRWRRRNLLVQVGMSAAVPQGGQEGVLFCHAAGWRGGGGGVVRGGRRGDSCGDQGSTAAIIHLPS